MSGVTSSAAGGMTLGGAFVVTGTPHVAQKRAPTVFGWPWSQRGRTSSPHTPQNAVPPDR
jgi:hypothetical protein